MYILLNLNNLIFLEKEPNSYKNGFIICVSENEIVL